MLCSAFPPPKTAVCVHGTARSFAHSLVHRSQRENLADAFRPDVTVFVHLARRDARGDPNPEYAGLFPESSEAQLREAARYLGAKVQHIRILEGPNAELPKCANYEENYEQRRTRTSHVESMAHLLSLAGQLTHREGCMALIRGEEAESRRRFDAVILVRADITIYLSFKPYCMYSWERPRRVRDWFYLVPRAVAEEVFAEPYKLFYNCTKGLRMGGNVDEYIAPFIRGTTEDLTLPVMITRLDQSHFPNNMCDRFRNPGALDSDPEPEGALCGPMTYKNPYNAPDTGALYPPLSRIACAAFRAPRLAICLHGAARALLRPVARRSQRENLVNALGAEAAVFVHLSWGGRSSGPRSGALEEQLEAAVRYLGASGQRAHVAEGAGGEVPRCAGQKEERSPALRGGFLEALAEQLSHRAGCMGLIAREEERAKARFDAVILARADLVVFAPLRPFCMYNLQRARRFRDWLLVAPRSSAEAHFVGPHDHFQRCGQELEALREADSLAYMARFVEGCEEDLSLPVMVAGLAEGPERDAACKHFRNTGALGFDPQPPQLCAAVARGS